MELYPAAITPAEVTLFQALDEYCLGMWPVKGEVASSEYKVFSIRCSKVTIPSQLLFRASPSIQPKSGWSRTWETKGPLMTDQTNRASPLPRLPTRHTHTFNLVLIDPYLCAIDIWKI